MQDLPALMSQVARSYLRVAWAVLGRGSSASGACHLVTCCPAAVSLQRVGWGVVMRLCVHMSGGSQTRFATVEGSRRATWRNTWWKVLVDAPNRLSRPKLWHTPWRCFFMAAAWRLCFCNTIPGHGLGVPPSQEPLYPWGGPPLATILLLPPGSLNACQPAPYPLRLLYSLHI